MDFIDIDGKMCGKPNTGLKKKCGTKLTRVKVVLAPQRSTRVPLDYAGSSGSIHNCLQNFFVPL